MIKLVHLSCSQSYLIAVGTVASRCRGNQLALRQLAWDCLRNGYEGIAGSRDAHGRIDVASS